MGISLLTLFSSYFLGRMVVLVLINMVGGMVPRTLEVG